MGELVHLLNHNSIKKNPIGKALFICLFVYLMLVYFSGLEVIFFPALYNTEGKSNL